MIVGFALHNLFFGEQVYVLGIPKPLAPPPDSRCRGLSRRSPSNQIKEINMTKSEYNKGGRPTKGAAEKKKYRITVKLNTQDYYTLKGKAKSAGVTMSEFVRKLLYNGNVIERLTVEQADFIRKLCGMVTISISWHIAPMRKDFIPLLLSIKSSLARLIKS